MARYKNCMPILLLRTLLADYSVTQVLMEPKYHFGLKDLLGKVPSKVSSKKHKRTSLGLDTVLMPPRIGSITDQSPEG